MAKKSKLPKFAIYCTLDGDLLAVGTARQIRSAIKHHRALGRTCCHAVELVPIRFT